MKPKLLLRNVGDIWDLSGDKRVTAKKDQDIINMASCRGISLLKDDSKLIFPHQDGIESYIEHVADYLMPGQAKAVQMKQMNSKLIPVKLKVGDATSEDYLDSDSINDTQKAMIHGGQLDPYVDGERAKRFAQAFECEYSAEFHDLFYKVRNKVDFHHFCQKYSLPTIPDSIGAGLEGGHEKQCQDIARAMKQIFEKGYPSVMIRQATAAGGIGNARINRIGGSTYEVARSKTVFRSEEELLNWLLDSFHKNSRTPGMMVAPFFGDGVSLSGIVEIMPNGEILVPYIAQEVLDVQGTSFQGAKIDNKLPKDYLNQAMALLSQAAMALKKEGVTQGRLQMDMRTVGGTVCAVESNSLRKTAVIEMFQILSNSANWIHEGAQRLRDGRQKSFISVEHVPVSDDFQQSVEELGFHAAFNQFRILSKQRSKEYLGSDVDETLRDIGVLMHASIPPHYVDGRMNIGLIVSDEAIRTALGSTSIQRLPNQIARLSLEEKWTMVKSVFQD